MLGVTMAMKDAYSGASAQVFPRSLIYGGVGLKA
jgi:hypothetical protein